MKTLEDEFLKKIMKEHNTKDKNYAYSKYVGSQYQEEAVTVFKDDYLPKICLLKEIHSSCINNDMEVKICRYITPFFKIQKMFLTDKSNSENSDNSIEDDMIICNTIN
jgi:hypothetical protein